MAKKAKLKSQNKINIKRLLNAILRVVIEESFPIFLEKIDPKIKNEYLKIQKGKEIKAKQEKMNSKKFKNEILITDYRIIADEQRTEN